MDEMRYRKPSVKTVLGITKLKKRVKKALGVNKLLAPFRAITNYQRRMLRRAGYYSPEMKMLRAAKRGQMPGPIGPLQVGDHQEHEHQSLGETALLAAALTKSSGEKHAQGHESHGERGSDLAQAMLLATALHGQDEGHEQRGEYEKRIPRKPASAAHAKQSEKPSSVKARVHARQSGR